ncbi:MAG: FadR/GntR family transcriptional regulator [bacterium]|nr:FadR/GntR family transcriptional regulator [bacterium]
MTAPVRLQAVKKVRVYEEIVSQITSLILNGDLKVGDRLPSERELCEQFDVGRNSVREATRALASARLVESRQGEGTFVIASADFLITHLSEQSSAEGESGIRYLFEARRILEPQIAALAVERITDRQLADLEKILNHQRREIQAGESGMAEDTAFHMALAAAAKNTFLERLLGTLLDSLREMREHSVRKQEDRARSLEGHQDILAALRRKNKNEALARMLSHLLGVEGQGMDLFKKDSK